MVSRYGFPTQQEQDDAKKSAAEAEAVRREKRQQLLDVTVQKIGPIIREGLAEYFKGMGLSAIDETGNEHPALIQEDKVKKGHAWKARSRLKTGTHSDYRADGLHIVDEHTAYSITVSLVVDKDGVPLLHVGNYVRSKLVDGKPVAASEFALEIPSELEQMLENKTGVKRVDRVKFLKAQDN